VASPAQIEDVASSQRSAAATNSPPTVNKVSTSSSAMGNVNNVFVDGTMPCDSPPVQFGAEDANVMYLGGNGWLNSQIGTPSAGGLANLRNAVGCPTPSHPGEKVVCNYNCPGTRLPTQFANQRAWMGANGESVGGLECRSDNRLYRINHDNNILCMADSSAVTVEVVNNMAQPIAICKTNYPGQLNDRMPSDEF
jgi:SUN family beta-glucosidase